MKKHSPVLTYVITILVGLAMAVAVLMSRGGFSQPDTESVYIVLSDAFFVPGIVLCGFGILAWVSHDGFFDAISYSASKVTSLFFSVFRKDERHQQYYDYKMEKQERRKKPGNAVIVTGVVFLLLAGMFMALLAMNGYELLPPG